MCLRGCDFNFFGYKINLQSNDENMISQIKYIYKEYLLMNQDSVKIDYFFYIENQNKSEILISDLIENNNVKVYHGKNKDEMEKWADKNTFLPPITAPYFREYFSFYHGCSVRIEDRTLAIFGPSRSGKTTLIMECLDRGAKLISDDIIILNNKNFKILTFKKPIGLRNTSKYYKEERINTVVRNKPFSVPTFKMEGLVTELIHITDIPKWEYFDNAGTIDEIYFIGSQDEFVEISSFYDFYNQIAKQACITNDNLKILIGIYKNLKRYPIVIDIRNHKKIWDILNL